MLVGEFDKVRTTDQYKIDSPNAETKDFYERFIISERMEISLLGYSLGGLFALSCFYDNTDSVKSCVLLNSGATVDKMTLKGIIDDSDWKKIVRKLKHGIGVETNPLIKENLRGDRDFPHIRTVFFSDSLFTPETIEEVGKKLILIIGGKDKIIPPESIKRLEPEGYGLNIVQISKLGHFLVGDVVFDLWYPRLIRILSDFFQEPEDTALSKREVMRILMAYHGVCGCSLFNLDDDQPHRDFLVMRNILRNRLEQDLNLDLTTISRILRGFEEAYKIVCAYVDSPVALYNQFRRIRKKAGLLFGDVLFSQCAWIENQKGSIKRCLSNKSPTQKVGVVFVENELLNHKQVGFVLARQLMQYKKLIEDSPHGKEWLDPVFAKLQKAQDAKRQKAKAKPKTTRKAPAKKKVPARRKAAKLTATGRVLKLIKQSKKGTDVPTLMKKTRYDERKVRNILFRAFKQGEIKRAGRGLYVGA